MNDKRIYHATLFIMLITAFAGGAPCLAQAATDKPTMEDVKKEVSEAAEAIKHYSADQRAEAINKAKSVMDSLDARIDKLKTSIDNQWKNMDQSARRKAQAALNDLKRQRQKTAEAYKELKESSAGAWEHMKKGFSDSYVDLHNAWQKAEKEFDRGK